MTRLRNLHDQMETHFRGLEALGADKESYSSVVIPWLLEKVPETIGYNMMRFMQKNHVEWTLELINALAAELEVRESHFPLTKMPQQDRNFGRPNKPGNISTGTAAALFAGRDSEKWVY